jgi:hypothetical protein
MNSPFNLLDGLEQGRYLLEVNKKPNNFIYLWIMNDKCVFKHAKSTFKSDTFCMKIKLASMDESGKNLSKKILYQFECDEQKDKNYCKSLDFKQLRNDINVNNLNISHEQFSFLTEMMQESNKQLCESLKGSNGLNFAIL